MTGNAFIDGLLEEFADDYNLTHFKNKEKIHKLFEYFVNYLIISKYNEDIIETDPSNLKQIDVDPNGGNYGIDGIAILVNDKLILSIRDINDFKSQNQFNSVEFVFTQSKTSSNFSSGDINNFTNAVIHFFDFTNDGFPFTEKTKSLKKLAKELITQNAQRINRKTGLRCTLYYATTGKPLNDILVEQVAETNLKTLRASLNSFENNSVDLKFVDGDNLIDSFKDLENATPKTINFEHRKALRKINNVEQAFIGYISVQEFLNLVCNTDGTLNRKIFEKNVRDFLGLQKNAVNKEIQITVRDIQDQFILLNNGITIVAKNLRPLVRTDEYEISDFQIVNGCQTTNVIYSNRDIINSATELWVPIKLIHTNDFDLIKRIVRATNRQSQVPDEAFISVEKFHERLKDFYKIKSKRSKIKLYYEQRKGEFNSSIERVHPENIITLHKQIKNFVATYFDEPQFVYTNHPNHILQNRKDRLFVEGQIFESYFVSSYIFSRLQKLIRKGKIAAQYDDYSYYICWIFRILTIGPKNKYGFLNSEEFRKNCEKMYNILEDEKSSCEYFEKAIDIIQNATREFKPKYADNELVRLTAFKDKILEELTTRMKN